MSVILIFPAGMPKSLEFKRIAKNIGLVCFEATSEKKLVSQSDGMIWLPYITDSEFETQLEFVLAKHEINLIYTPHSGVWLKLNQISQSANFSRKFRVCGEWPNSEDLRSYSEAYEWARTCKSLLDLPIEAVSPSLPIFRYGNLYRGFNNIPGESDDEKIWLLTQIFRYAEPGDVVEIGSAYGRSAFSLAWLSDSYQIGTLICIDPWDFDSSKNQGGQASLINEAAHHVAWDQVFMAFLVSLAGFRNVNFIRKPSNDAINDYRVASHAKSITTEEFGSTPLTGEISILHIDGNHRYEDVKNDLDTWLPFVKEGGWVLLDDYLWAFGDGPKRVGDEFITNPAVRFSFVVGDTLCVKLKG